MTQRRTWAVVVVTFVASSALLPPGAAIVGAIIGGLSSLLAIGLVLAYRAHRFLNVAHASLGAVAGSLVSYLVAHAGWSFWLAYPAGLVTGAVLGMGAGILLGERLADASRTVVVAASLGLAFIFGGAHVGLGLMTGSVLAFEVPIPLSLDVFPVQLSGTHMFAALTIPTALLGTWSFLHRSDFGLRVRALAGSARHARRIGVDPHATWRVLWAVLGVLAASAGIVSQPLLGTTVERGPLLGPLLVALAAAAIGGMRDLSLTVGASIALGVAYQAILWRSPVAAAADVALLLIIASGFALRGSMPRLDERHDPPHHRLVRSPRPAPDRLRPVVTVGRLGVAAAFVLLVIVVVPFLTPGDAQRLGAIGVFVMAGLCVHILAAYRGWLTLGAWAMVGVGAIAAGRVGGGSLRGVGAAIVAGAVTSVVLGLLVVPGGVLAHAAVSLAAAFAFAAVVRHLPFPGPMIASQVRTLGPISLEDPATVAVIIVSSCAFIALAAGSLRHTRLGRDALALREDPRLAAVHGVRALPTRLGIDAVAGAVAGLAGTLYLWSQRVIHPDAFQAVRSLELAAMTITGGIGSVLGPFFGGAVVKGSELFASGPLHLFATGAGLLLVVMWLRGGLVSLVDVVRDRLSRRHVVASVSVSSAPDVVARFCPAPAAETRKARHDPTVGHLATTALTASCGFGIVLRVIVAGRSPALVIWIVAAAMAFAAIGTAIGHMRPRLVLGSAAIAGGAVLAVAWAPVLLIVIVATGYVLGSALRLAGDRVAHPLAHASRGWIALQSLIGVMIGAVVMGGESTDLWLVAVGSGALLVAANSVTQPSTGALRKPASAALSVVDATVTLGGTCILRDAELHVGAGEIVGVVGANGVGKTTLLRCIAGETQLEGGSVFIRHTDVTVLAPEERFALGVMLSDAEDGSDGELTVRDNLRVAALSTHRRSCTTDAIEVVGCLHPSLVHRLDDRAAVLSGGERRVLALAQIAVAQPSVLLVDELARGLSGEALDSYRALLRELASRGAAIVVVDHDVSRLVTVADRIVRLSAGRLRRAAGIACSVGVTR